MSVPAEEDHKNEEEELELEKKRRAMIEADSRARAAPESLLPSDRGGSDSGAVRPESQPLANPSTLHSSFAHACLRGSLSAPPPRFEGTSAATQASDATRRRRPSRRSAAWRSWRPSSGTRDCEAERPRARHSPPGRPRCSPLDDVRRNRDERQPPSLRVGGAGGDASVPGGGAVAE